MHAFDADKLEGRHIIVRRADRTKTDNAGRRGTRSLILPSSSLRTLKKPVALAGIMGGGETRNHEFDHDMSCSKARTSVRTPSARLHELSA